MSNLLRSLAGLLFLSLLIVTPLTAAAAEPPPLAAYGRLPEFEDAAISPSGRNIAAVATLRDQRLLLFYDSALELKRATPIGDLKVRGVDWIGEDAVLPMTSQTEDLGPRFIADQYEAYRALVVPTDPAQPLRVVFSGNRNIVTSIFGSYGKHQVDNESSSIRSVRASSVRATAAMRRLPALRFSRACTAAPLQWRRWPTWR